jgi:ribosomal protein S18 acetylase RimI-like enzyme
MQDPAIRAATASEPLTLEEEHEMQGKWREDGDKLTFIVGRSSSQHGDGGGDGDLQGEATGDGDGKGKGEMVLIGDVNLFVSTRSLDDQDEAQGTIAEVLVGELELMIALPSEQRKGFGRAALLMMLGYIVGHEEGIVREYVRYSKVLAQIETESTDMGSERDEKKGDGFDYFEVKIQQTNERSIKLFEGMGFRKVKKEANYFGEVEMRLGRSDVGVEELMEQAKIERYQEGKYEERAEVS